VLIDAPMALTLSAMKLTPEEIPSRLATVLQIAGALPSGFRGPSTSSSSSSSSNLVKLMITQCSITELYRLQKQGETESRAVDLAKDWERRYCSHKETLPGDRCICEVIGECKVRQAVDGSSHLFANHSSTNAGDRNKHRYVLAAGSAGLRAKIRNEVVGVPVVHANDRNVMVMEPMSRLTKEKCDEVRELRRMKVL
jgi:rRNA-processing protein FCF1